MHALAMRHFLVRSGPGLVLVWSGLARSWSGLVWSGQVRSWSGPGPGQVWSWSGPGPGLVRSGLVRSGLVGSWSWPSEGGATTGSPFMSENIDQSGSLGPK